MAIKYLSYQILEATHIETGEKKYELSHWYYSEDIPSIAGRRHCGYFDTAEQAENHHVKLMIHEKFKEKEGKLLNE